MRRLESLSERITPRLLLLLAIGGALLVATPSGAAPPLKCKPDGVTCSTNQSCCSGVCTANVCTTPTTTTTSTTTPTPSTTTTTLRFVDNGDGTVTDNQTGLQWEQKTGTVRSPRTCQYAICPWGNTFTGTYSATSPCGGGTFTITVSSDSETWTGQTVDTAGCSVSASGTITVSNTESYTVTGTAGGVDTVSGIIDCGTGGASGTFSGPVNGAWELTTNYCPDPHDVNNTYAWSDSGTAPDGTAFTDFLGKLNNCTSSDGTAVTYPGFAGHCDWRLPTSQELQAILLAPYPCDETNLCIDPTFYPTAGGPYGSFYWSATTVEFFPDYAWLGDFDHGAFGVLAPKFVFDYVRAVRSGS